MPRATPKLKTSTKHAWERRKQARGKSKANSNPAPDTSRIPWISDISTVRKTGTDA